MSIEENKAIIQRWYDGWNSRDLDVINKDVDELVAPDAVSHMEGAPDGHGIEAIRKMWTGSLTSCPESKQTFEIMIAEGDYVALRETYEMKHTGGEFFGAPPTGKTISMISHDIYKVVDGKIVEMWGQWGPYNVFQQLGMIPEDLP